MKINIFKINIYFLRIYLNKRIFIKYIKMVIFLGELWRLYDDKRK